MAANNENQPKDGSRTKRPARDSEKERFFELGTGEEVFFKREVNGYRKEGGGVVARCNIEVRHDNSVIGAAGAGGQILRGQKPKGALPRKKTVENGGKGSTTAAGSAPEASSSLEGNEDLKKEIEILKGKLTALEGQKTTETPPTSQGQKGKAMMKWAAIAAAVLVGLFVLGTVFPSPWNKNGQATLTGNTTPLSAASTVDNNDTVARESVGDQSAVIRGEDNQIRRMCIRDPRGDPFCCWGVQPQTRRVTGGMQLYCSR